MAGSTAEAWEYRVSVGELEVAGPGVTASCYRLDGEEGREQFDRGRLRTGHLAASARTGSCA